MIPCYVSGRGMGATETTRDFKVTVIRFLEESGMGFDTRFRYYRKQFPEMEAGDLARLVCDPIENYDRDWPEYLSRHRGGREEADILAAYVLERDAHFRNEAAAAIYNYDEAGFGSGVNSMRFIRDGKPLLGFYSLRAREAGTNLTNVLQLAIGHSEWVTLIRYDSLEEIPAHVGRWLRERFDPRLGEPPDS